MTTQNFFNLAKSGDLELDRFYGGAPPAYCIAAAVDCLFERLDVSLDVYKANDQEMQKVKAGDTAGVDRFFATLGKVTFGVNQADTPCEREYCFDTFEEFADDLRELRLQQSTILIDTGDGTHSQGLKPAGSDKDVWQIVGLDQLVHVMSADKVDVQALREPETMTTAQVWDYLLRSNSEAWRPLTALVLPPEPQH